MPTSTLRTAALVAPLTLGLLACNVLSLKVGSPRAPASSTSDPPTSTAPSTDAPRDDQRRQRAREWYTQCSAEYDAFMAVWKPIDDEAKAVIAAQKGKPFHAAYPRLAGQYVKTRAEALRLLGKHNTPSSYGDRRGTGLELLLAIAALQADNRQSQVLALDAGDAHRNALPLTGDDAFDRASFCSVATYAGTRGDFGGIGKLAAFDTSDQTFPAPWMTTEELKAWSGRVRDILQANRATLDALLQQRAARGAVDGDYGVIKKLQPQPDGSLRAEARAIDTPYRCEHTGNWRWIGNEWTDCDYVDLKPQEMYPFAFVLADDPLALKVGDKVNIVGKHAATSSGKRDGAVYEDVMIRALYRRGKLVFDGIDAPIDR